MNVTLKIHSILYVLEDLINFGNFRSLWLIENINSTLRNFNFLKNAEKNNYLIYNLNLFNLIEDNSINNRRGKYINNLKLNKNFKLDGEDGEDIKNFLKKKFQNFKNLKFYLQIKRLKKNNEKEIYFDSHKIFLQKNKKINNYYVRTKMGYGIIQFFIFDEKNKKTLAFIKIFKNISNDIIVLELDVKQIEYKIILEEDIYECVSYYQKNCNSNIFPII